MSTDPDQIRREIEATRSNLSNDVNELYDRVNPASIARRQSNRLRESVVGVKDKLMGSAQDAKESVMGTAQQAKESVVGSAHDVHDSSQSLASNVGGAVSGVPGQVQTKTQGNPVAAGVIAFGVGMLLSALVPASRVEARAATAVKESAQPLVEKVTDAAKEVAGNLQEPAQNALESVKSSAADAAGTVEEEGVSSATDVKDHAVQAKDTVAGHLSDS